MLQFAKSFAIMAFIATFSHSAVNYPYPQEISYGNSTINVTSANASSTLKSRFNSFLTGFYEEGTGANNNLARIKFDNTSQTVSEGIGYGMIMMVYFSDNTTSYQSHFDKLWAYYKKWPNNNGLMHWKINGFSNVVEQNAATDAEYDVALALVMAYYQFGDNKYKDDATALIAKIRQFEMESDGLHKPGDAWNTKRNPSYISPAAYEIFKSFDGNNSDFWSKAITRNYTLLKNNQNSNTGLPSNWCNDDGNPGSGDDGMYGYDAARAPWRWAWANAWYGHADAKTLLAKLATWVNNQTISNVGGSISLTGTLGGDKNSTFLGPLTNTLSYSSTYQNKMNDYWTALIGKGGEPYFSAAMQLITGLLATGNMPNLKALADGSGGIKLSSSSARSSSSGNSGYTRIDNFQEEDGLARTYEAWFAYTDVNDNGATTISNTVKGQSTEGPEYTVVMQDGSDWVAKLDRYTLSKGQNQYDPYAALGLNAVNNQKSASQGGYDLSKCTGGFRYDYKGSAHNFKMKMTTVEDYGYHYKKVTASTSWATETVTLVDVVQPIWADNVTFDIKKVNGFDWEVKGDEATGSATTGSLAIKNFDCIGNMDLPPAPSSSSGTSVAGSSSSYGGVKPSSSSNNSTPILFSPIANKNAIQLINNGISLQTTTSANLEIFNINGTLLRKMNLSSGIYSIEFSDLPKGLYIAKIRFGNSGKEVLKVPVK